MSQNNTAAKIISTKRNSPLTPLLFCEECQKEVYFMRIHTVLQTIGVSRSTVYYWMEHDWIHWKELPSGRRVICQESLSHQSRTGIDLQLPEKNSSESVRKRPVVSNPVR